jgi:hypothetical protein
MEHKHEKMDEEKTFEVIEENITKVNFDTSGPQLVRRGLTEVSAMFDRHGKGYLDDTERALRRMDSQDRGYLGIDKVCVIFESLQAEQERSSHLLEALREENKKSLSLKRAVIALTFFTILLALANVGTSFAVSKLVKDTAVGNGDLLVKGSNVRVGTTGKLMVFEMEGLDDGRRRRLQSAAGLICESMAETVSTGSGSYTEKECSLQGTIKLPVAEDLHKQLNTVDRVLLTCHGKKSTIFGGSDLPGGYPGNMMMGTTSYKMFPSTNANEKYAASQRVSVPARPYTPATGNTPAVFPRPAGTCTAEYDVAMYCPTAAVGATYMDCLVMTAFLPTQNCPTSPIICGNP